MNPEWLIDCEPRPVQLEGLRRSFYGVMQQSSRDDGFVLPEQFRKGPDAGWGHFLEMRLGKTPLTLAEYALFQKRYGFHKLLVISPNTYKEDWATEFKKYGLTDPVHVFESRHREEARALRHGFMVVNYEALKERDTMAILEAFIDNKTMVVADESIKMKTHDSLQTSACLELGKLAPVTRVLSGMPLSKGPADLYAQFRFIKRLEGHNFYAFRNKYSKMGGFKKKKVVGTRNEEQLEAFRASCSFTAKRKDWADPLVAEYYTSMLHMGPEQQRAYDEMNQELYLMLESGFEIAASQVVTKLLKLQQISSGFIIDDEKRVHRILPASKTPKMARLKQILEETDQKVIVFFHYQQTGDDLLEELAEFNPAKIRSAQWMKRNGVDIVSEKARFNNDRSCRVIVANTTAAKYGHDLSGVHGDRCGTTVYFENNYNLDDREQTEKRNTAAVQDWNNVYIDLVSSPVEEQAVKSLIEKMDLVESVMGSYGLDRARRVLPGAAGSQG